MESIGKYQITGELGSGGFGRVYKAFDPTVGRVVAIKVLNVQDDPALVMRFEAEAKTSANLQHKNIVIVHEFGEQIIDERTKKQFLVMEYLSGKNLQEIINEGTPIPPLEKLVIMSEVAQGLQFAHEHGVVHRDVKPANIMRLSDGSVKIMDFGIARLMRGASTRLTQAGIMIGTPQYMAPEQFTTETADEKCDVWAYGVVFYEFLAGVNPFHGDNAPQMIFRVTAEEPPPITSLVAGVPRSLDAILRRLLAKNRDDRYATLEDVRFDLEPVLVELRRAQVEDDLARAGALIAEERLDEALVVVRRILDFDQTNAQARKWRRELPERIKAQSMQMRIKALMEQADAEATRRDYAAALEKLAEAVRLDRSNQRVRGRLDEILAEQERVGRSVRLVNEAQAEYARNDLTIAFEHAKEAAKADPGNSEAPVLVQTIGKAIERQESENQRRAGLNKAKGLILVQAYENAVTVLRDLEVRYPGDAEVKERLDEARRLQGAYVAQQKIEATILESRELIRKSQFQRAIDTLAAMPRDIPQQKQIEELLSYAREQLETEKRAAEVEDLIRRASDMQGGDFEAALRLIDRAIDLAPTDERAQRIRKNLLTARQADLENRAILRSVQDCRALLLGGRLDEAITSSAELKARHPDHAGVKALVKEVDRLIAERQEKKDRQIQTYRREVEQLIEQGKPDRATERLNTLTVEFPNEPIFRDLIPKATAAGLELKKREAEQKKRDAIQASLKRALDLSAVKRWDPALAELERGLTAWPGAPELLQEKERIAHLKLTDEAAGEIQKHIQRHELEAAAAVADSLLAKFPGEARIAELRETCRQQLEFERLLREADRLVLQGEIGKAEPVVADLLRRAPGDPNVQRLKQIIEQRQKRLQDFAAADLLCKRRKFQEAHDLVIRILLEDPEDGAAADLLKRIEREGYEYEVEQYLESNRLEAAELIKHRQFLAAVQLLEKVSGEFPDEQDVRDDLQRAQEALAQSDRKDLAAKGRSELESIMKQVRFEDAIAKARQLAAEFPEEGFERDLDAAVKAKELRDQRLRKDAAVAEIEGFFRQDDAATVRQMAEKFLATGQDLRVRELRDWAIRREKELEDLRRKIDGPRFDWRWIAAIVALPLVLYGLWKIVQPPPPPMVELHVAPMKLDFSYRPGDVVLAAQTLQLTGKPAGTVWSVSMIGDPWFRATPAEMSGDGPITVQIVDPQKMTPGEYSGIVSISAKNGGVAPATVGVHLTIAPPLPKPGTPTLQVSPTELTFSHVRGGALPSDKLVSLSGQPSNGIWSTRSSQTWLQVPGEVTGSGRVPIHVAPQDLMPGPYAGSVTFTPRGSAESSATVTVLLTVTGSGPPTPAPSVTVQPSTLTFTYTRGGPPPAAQSFQVIGQPPSEAWSITTPDQWISANPIDLKGSGSVSVKVDPTGRATGDGTVKVLSRRGAGVPATVNIKLIIQDPVIHQTDYPTVNCTADDYPGLKRGDVKWPGLLMPGQALTIDMYNTATSAPSGAPSKATGQALPGPGCEVIVRSTTTGVDVADQPSVANHGQVTLRNTSQSSVNGVGFHWQKR
ncbi:MAG TPA: protein kinase [Bryobacteraceae bacterium]|nr:protein kinase [Bryobacteraceae bacterium]